MNSKFPYTRDHIDLLLVQMLLSPSIMETVVSSQIEMVHIKSPEINGSLGQALLFDVILDYYREYEIAPDDATILANAQARLDSGCPNPERQKQFIARIKRSLALKEHADERGEPLARKIVKEIARFCVFRPAAKEILHDAAATGDIDGLGKQITELEAKQSSISGGLSFNNILNRELEGSGERIGTLIPWVDRDTGGGNGPVNGSVIGIIAPQNGGKTTLGIQLAVKQALGQRHALLVLAEEGLTQSMKNKIMGCALGIDYTLFEREPVENVINGHFTDWSSKKLAREKLANINEYFHVLDMVKDNTVPEGIAPIQSEISQLCSRGHKPAYVYVDWAGIIADAVMQRTKRTKEAEIQSLSHELAQEAYRTNCIIGISQQMAADVVKRGPFNRPDMYCAADCRMFTAPMKYALAVNKQDSDSGNSLMTWVKSRDDGILGHNLILRLRGEIASFENVTDNWDLRGKRFVRKGHDLTNKIPTESKQAPHKV